MCAFLPTDAPSSTMQKGPMRAFAPTAAPSSTVQKGPICTPLPMAARGEMRQVCGMMRVYSPSLTAAPSAPAVCAAACARPLCPFCPPVVCCIALPPPKKMNDTSYAPEKICVKGGEKIFRRIDFIKPLEKGKITLLPFSLNLPSGFWKEGEFAQFKKGSQISRDAAIFGNPIYFKFFAQGKPRFSASALYLPLGSCRKSEFAAYKQGSQKVSKNFLGRGGAAAKLPRGQPTAARGLTAASDDEKACP